MPILRKQRIFNGLNLMKPFSLLILLTACETTHSEVCPPLVEYTADFQDTVYAEARHMKSGDPILKMLDDYKRLRNEISACNG